MIKWVPGLLLPAFIELLFEKHPCFNRDYLCRCISTMSKIMSRGQGKSLVSQALAVHMRTSVRIPSTHIKKAWCRVSPIILH